MRPLHERIDEAERLAKEGWSAKDIMELAGIGEVTARCIVGRVVGGDDFSSLRKCKKDDAR